MGATITVNVKVSKEEAQAVVEQIRRALESVTNEPININVTQNVTQVDNNVISVYNRSKNAPAIPGTRS
jgi:hypothetical protein